MASGWWPAVSSSIARVAWSALASRNPTHWFRCWLPGSSHWRWPRRWPFTLGLLAVALVIGRAIAGRGKGGGDRAAAMRGLVVGLFALSLVWFGASLMSGIPVAGVLARIIALAFTWAVATVGLGAVVTTRGGVAKLRMDTTLTEVAAPSWQTPTPVFGVVAARRPSASPSADAQARRSIDGP